MFNKKNLLALSISTIFLSACGGSSDPAEQVPPVEKAEMTSFSLAISDAPVEALSEVVVCFNQVELKNADGDVIFTVGGDTGVIEANDLCLDSNNNVIANTVGINLLDYTGSESIALVSDIDIAAGDYSQMRLIMSDGSYGIDEASNEKIAISVPSNELKLDGFTATLGGTVDFTLEFDLRKSMTNPVGKAGYFLKPRGVRLVNNNAAGHIEGSVSETFLINNQCEPLSHSAENIASVYLYQGQDLAIDTLADNGGAEENQALASSTVTFNSETSTYQFAIGFINADIYTIAVSCDTQDDPDADDVITFISAQNVTVTAGNEPVQVSFDIE